MRWMAWLMALLVCFNGVSVQVAPNDKDHRPTQLRLSWSDDPKTTMILLWQTAAPAADAFVEFGLTNPSEQRFAARLVRYPYETGAIYEASRLLDEYKLDLVLAGHNHNYERTYPLKKGEERQMFIQTVIGKGKGSSSSPLEGAARAFTTSRLNALPSRLAVKKIYHYLKVRVMANILTVEFVRTDEGICQDRFTIVARSDLQGHGATPTLPGR